MDNHSTTRNHWGVLAAAGAALAGFAAVITAIELMAVRGQLDFGTHVIGLSGAWVYVVPVALEGGTLVSASLALWSVLTRDPSFGHRMWTGVFLGAAALANYLGSVAAGRPTIAALYLAGFAVAALRMWHAILHRVTRGQLRATGAMEAPLPRWRTLRWLVAPGETFRAWRYAVREGITRPAEALAAARAEVRPATVTADGVDLGAATKSDAWGAAFAAVGDFDVPRALDWLTERGVDADRSYGYEVRKRLINARRGELHAVTAAPVKKAPARKARKAAEAEPAERKAAQA
ncbi:MAG: DUF2637 domain-containing protein [Thermoanaerobaculia bacterium]